MADAKIIPLPVPPMPASNDFASFLQRRLAGDYEVDDFGFDAELTERVFLPAFRTLYRDWFRVEVSGAEHLPVDGGALIVANHSGTIAIDALMTQVAVHDSSGRFLRTLGADFVFRMPFLSEVARRGGTTLACTADAERLLKAGELVGVWPEGYKGVGKPYSQRYRLQRFGRGGFVAAALRTGVPLIPCSIVGAEEAYPMLGNSKLLARLIGAPYFPLTPTFPWLGPLGLIPLRSKWLIRFGEPIYPADLAVDADDTMAVLDLTDSVREQIQATLYELLAQRAASPR